MVSDAENLSLPEKNQGIVLMFKIKKMVLSRSIMALRCRLIRILSFSICFIAQLPLFIAAVCGMVSTNPACVRRSSSIAFCRSEPSNF